MRKLTRRGRLAALALTALSALGMALGPAGAARAETVPIATVDWDTVAPGTVISAAERNDSITVSMKVDRPVDPFRAPCLDADSDTIGKLGSRVQVWDCQSRFNQHWFINSTERRGLYRIHLAVTTNNCLDADNRFGGGNGSILQGWKCLGNGEWTNQYWWAVGGPDDTVFWVSNLVVHDGSGAQVRQCMTIDNRDPNVLPNGNRAVLFTCDARFTPQRFHLTVIPRGLPPIDF